MTEILIEKFKNYRKSLNNSCAYGLLHLKVVGSLMKYLRNNQDDYLRLSVLFFRTTEDAHFEIFFSYLLRIFDPHPDALSINKFLNFIESNLNILFPNNRDAVITQVRMDRQSLEANQVSIDKLIEIRNKAHFHQDSRFAGRYMQVYRQNEIPAKELEKLMKLVLKMIDFYSTQFDGRKVKFDLAKFIDVDIADLFKFINRGKKAFEEDAKR